MTDVNESGTMKKRWFRKCRGSNKFVILVVAVALFLDNMLLTIIVPIIPEYLYDERRTADNQTKGLNTTSISAPRENKLKHEYLMAETTEVGLMIGSKAIVQLLTNPIVGPLTNRFGYQLPMFFGFCIMFVSTLLFAFGISYQVLFLARALQGVGSACASVSGMGLLADRYTDDTERGKAMALSLSGLAFGVIVGPPVGGVLYQFLGKTIPFLIVCVSILVGIFLQIMMILPKSSKHKSDKKSPSLITLIMDPFIIITAGGMCISNIGFALLDTSLAIWMIDTMNSESWELGIVFLPCNILYWIGISMFPNLNEKLGRWLTSMIGMFFTGLALSLIPFSGNITILAIPIGIMGLANAMCECALLPELAHLVDMRYSSIYGNVYAIGDFAICLGFGIGPICCGFIMEKVGFTWMMIGSTIMCFVYTPLLYLLRNPSRKRDIPIITPANEKLISIEMKATNHRNTHTDDDH